jgi:hypothetical protein
MASLTSNNKSVSELLNVLDETSRNSQSSRADRDAVLIAILKQHQETIEQNKKTIKEQKELIEHLWAWAEEKDEDEGAEKEGEDDDDDFRDIASSFGTQYIDYTNFKLCDEYCGERVGFVYLKGIHGPGYYALKK